MPPKLDEHAFARQYWRNVARVRPENIASPGPGQESVWDYPRPPVVQLVARRIRVEFDDEVIADTQRALRVIETSSPPVYYVPPQDVRREFLAPAAKTTFCEWKGVARYWTVRVHQREAVDAAWSYPQPDEGYAAIRDFFAFFAGRVDACFVGDERVMPQPGDYYGGWVTAEIVGPFKGDPGTEGW